MVNERYRVYSSPSLSGINPEFELLYVFVVNPGTGQDRRTATRAIGNLRVASEPQAQSPLARQTGLKLAEPYLLSHLYL